MPRLSIIIPCFNSEKYISKTIESVLNQSFQDWELLIVNDGSTDNSVEEIVKFVRLDDRIKLFSIENGGVNRARNFGYSKISPASEYLHFLDSDDMIESNFHSDLIYFLDNNLEFGAVYSDHYFINESDKIIDLPDWGKRYNATYFWFKEQSEDKIETSKLSIALWCKMVEPMVVIRRKDFELSRKWDSTFKYGIIGEGVVLFTEIATKKKVGYINKKLFAYRRHSSQSSQQKQSINLMDLSHQILIEDKILPRRYKYIFYRFKAFKESKKLKHLLRFKQLNFLQSGMRVGYFYFKSLFSIFFNYN